MAGCSVVLLMILISPLLFGLGIVLGALFVLKLAFDAVVGTIALPLLVVSIACGITATAIVVRMLWLHFHDHQELDLPGMLVLPAVLAAVAFVAFCVALVVSGLEFFALFQASMESSEETAAVIAALL